ncbi:sigma factor-binding protein Crl [Dongshaea marina]|uniref:sigma factor-binding protein Crl n=1 Tax=Dongshaea marina TaxID=2047966 RepID=UPI000D3EDF70|nr:sigma factor-binding protein Crl [Dongshaea marina]
MSTEHLPYNRLIRQFMALGPYLREEHCEPQKFFFDCLACCVSAKKAPDKREFWGWWLILEQTPEHFSYHYKLGQLTEIGEWKEAAIPKKHQLEVNRTLREFYQRLSKKLEEYAVEIEPADSLAKDKVIHAA